MPYINAEYPDGGTRKIWFDDPELYIGFSFVFYKLSKANACNSMQRFRIVEMTGDKTYLVIEEYK